MDETRPGLIGMTIAGKGEYVGARSFEESFKDTLAVLQELDRSVSGVANGTIEWEIVGATVQSPLTLQLGAKSTVAADYGTQVVNAFLDGVEMLDRESQVPRHFTPTALDAMKRISDLFGNGVSRITYTTPSRRVTPSNRVGVHISQMTSLPKVVTVEPARSFSERGTVEGTVDSLIGHDQLYFSLYDALSGKRVRCDFHRNLSEDVRAAWQRRVVVDGLIYYGADGKIDVMRADSVKVKADRSRLPQFKGTYINITGGVESSEYVRGLRDDD